MGTKGVTEWLKYGGDFSASFPYIPADEIFRLKPSVFGHKSPRFGIVSNFWENYTASEWTRDSAEGETPLIFMGHSRGGAVADIAAWHTATFRGIEHKNMASGYQQIGTVSFGQPAVFTSFLSEYFDGFSRKHSFKTGFREDSFLSILTTYGRLILVRH